MAETQTLQDTFAAGVRRDNSRDQIPRGGLWWAEDMIPNLDARLRERGGWSYASNDIAAAKASASYVIAGIYAPFSAGSLLVAIDEDGEAYKIASDLTVTDVAACVAPAQNPVFHRDKVIVPGSTVKKITSSAGTLTVANLGGSPPAGSYATVFNDRTLLARTSGNTNRLYFSDPGDPELWDTTNSYWDFTFPITGLANLKTAILVFHEAYVSRLRGTTPPPGSDFFADDPLWNVGCTDARSIAYYNDRVIFASAEGIFYTDGAGVEDLTAKVGMVKWWQETLASYSSTWTIAGAVIRDHYFLAVMDGATFKTGAMIDLRRFAWWPTTNIDARSMWVGQGAADELYFGRRSAARVGKLSSVFMPASGVKNDADGTAVTGLVESPFYRGRSAQKGWRRLFVTQYLRDYATDNPTVAVSYLTTPEATSYTSLGTFSENTAEGRQHLSMGFSSSGVALKLARANAGDWQLNALEADVHAREGSR